MAFTINAFNHAEWQRLGLLDYADFADRITECNQGEDAFGGYGEWYYIPEARLPNNDAVIYYGSWGNDHSPGASMYTHATIFDMDDPDDAAEYTLRVQEMQSQPEYDEQAESDDQP
jgi:hypothetical protein